MHIMGHACIIYAAVQHAWTMCDVSISQAASRTHQTWALSTACYLYLYGHVFFDPLFLIYTTTETYYVVIWRNDNCVMCSVLYSVSARYIWAVQNKVSYWIRILLALDSKCGLILDLDSKCVDSKSEIQRHGRVMHSGIGWLSPDRSSVLSSLNFQMNNSIFKIFFWVQFHRRVFKVTLQFLNSFWA